ncbi:MAG: radical SAM protein, partial [Dehalococcoidales bacterium]|nr:radical SAM protein [Dehalococcoidales bacterium]
ADLDLCGCGGMRAAVSPHRFLYRARLPGGGTVSLFKVLLTNVCVNDCIYCAHQAGRDIPRTSFAPEELARLFLEMYERRLARGLFLSSGIGVDASRTMEAMLKTAEILRRKRGFSGYIHLKILPGAGYDCVEEACRLASRVSINMEAPTKEHLARLSRRKDLLGDILRRMERVKEIISRQENLVPSGQTTQFVVGAAGETDRDILATAVSLYRDMRLKRVYFSAFRPVADSPSEGIPPAPPLREHRLYQADWLIREYGFPPDEVLRALDENGNLPLESDPKLALARRQPWRFPVDVNRAGYGELIRVPGIGPATAKRIITARRESRIASVAQLRRLGVTVGRALPFIHVSGLLEHERQLALFPEDTPHTDSAGDPSLPAPLMLAQSPT